MNNKTRQQNDLLLISKYRTVIMGFAALWIFFFHVWINIFPGSTGGASGFSLEEYIRRIGFYGVDIFFLLSGYGLHYAINKESLPHFYYRRLRRVYPPFLLMAGLYAFIDKWDIAQFWGNISGYNFYMKNIFSFLWFFPAIITLYILFPVYNVLLVKFRTSVLCGATILLWFATTVLLRDTLRTDLFGFTNRIPIFVVGILFGYYSTKKQELSFRIQHWILLLFTFFSGLILAYFYNFTRFHLLIPIGNTFLPGFLIAISFPFLFAKLMNCLEKTNSILRKGIFGFFSFFGTISLELYAIQELANAMALTLLYDNLPSLAINIIQFVIFPAIAWVLNLGFNNFWKKTEHISHKSSSQTN